MDLRASMWDTTKDFVKVCVYNLPQNFSASKLSWYMVNTTYVLHVCSEKVLHTDLLYMSEINELQLIAYIHIRICTCICTMYV